VATHDVAPQAVIAQLFFSVESQPQHLSEDKDLLGRQEGQLLYQLNRDHFRAQRKEVKINYDAII